MPPKSISNTSPTGSLTVEQFTNHPDVLQCLEKLKSEFSGDGKRPFVVSDTLDDEGHQYVNLVQKGGGVLGVALIGYTYILEQMGNTIPEIGRRKCRCYQYRIDDCDRW